MSALLLAVVAALLAALGDVFQRRVTRVQPDHLTGTWRLLGNLVRHPVWLAGAVLSLAGLSTHVVALSLGEITVVQPVLVLELPFAVIIAAWLSRERLAARDGWAIVLMAVGVAVFVSCLAPTGGDPGSVSPGAWAVGLGVLLTGAGVLTLAGARTTANRRAGLLGAAAGVGYGATAVLVSAVGAVAHQGAAAVLGAWPLYGAVAVGVGSFVLLQNALAAGRLMATAPGLTLVNPLVAVLCGVLLFGETPRPGVWVVGAVAGAALLVAGTVRLAGSPALTDGSGDRRAHRNARFATVTPRAARATPRVAGSTRGPHALPPSEGQIR
ncbi:DMT family transporter [Actinomycetospora sp. CA-101289]|uniref:DMT family transporter n=1 Tax=Actinomycetospora sp. CA-101289 TaxID=3239893 RepID=UPI003D97079A